MLIDNILLGLVTALQPINLMWCFIGVFVGTLIGVIPGIGALAAISMLFPLTFHLDPTAALIMLAGIWYGTAYGGSTASILLNLPGTPSSAVSCLDGYPMAKQGRAGIALLMCAMSSFVGGSIGILLMMTLSPIIIVYALKFGAPEYFALMLMGLVASCTISSGSAAKALGMTALGILFGCVGMDKYTAAPRFDFGALSLYEGLGLVALAMGVFGIAELVSNIGLKRDAKVNMGDFTMRAMMPTREDVRRSILPTLRGSGIGSFIGALPGVGPSIASFLSYAIEQKVSDRPQMFGRGAIEGVTAPEAANNAADQTAFIPTMTMGLPGSPTMAIMLGALMIQGIAPGPTLMTNHPDLFWGLVMSFWIGNLLLLIINIPMIGLWVRLLAVPYHLLYPSILVFIAIGAYSINNNVFDIWMVILFGVVGYLMRVLDLPAAPLILGFVLGPLMEENFRRTMLISRGNLEIFMTRPICAVIMAITLALLLGRLWQVWRSRERAFS